MPSSGADTEGTRERLFVAVELPGAVLEELERAAEVLRTSIGLGRWTPTTNRHVTVKFLGWVWPRLVPWILQEIESVARTEPAFVARSAGLGTFPPGRRRARVLWAGFEDPHAGFARLAAGLDVSMAREFEPEKRAFTAHVTLARFDPPVEPPVAFPTVASEPFTVDHVALFRSHLRRPAPVYERLASFPLGPPAQ
jgi:2'-5' RNA ligase